MEMTDFEIGKKYRLPTYQGHQYIYVGPENVLMDRYNQIYFPTFSFIKRDDWEEYKEPIDYGESDNHKLFLLDDNCKIFWVEGYCDATGKVVYMGMHEMCFADKQAIIKVIDLPSKGLTHE
jgi:hypothetical protein